ILSRLNLALSSLCLHCHLATPPLLVLSSGLVYHIAAPPALLSHLTSLCRSPSPIRFEFDNSRQILHS
ncbi:hypothetical protein L195_g021484, partial [Trifolium pratense]